MPLIGTPRSCNNVTVITEQQPQPSKLSVGWQSLAIVGEKSRRSAPSPEPFGWLAPPKSTRVWEPTVLWNEFHQQRVGEVAVRALERAVTMDPNNSITHRLLGQAYRDLGRNEDAERELKSAEQLQERGSGKQ
jgi:hypothetical protein